MVPVVAVIFKVSVHTGIRHRWGMFIKAPFPYLLYHNSCVSFPSSCLADRWLSWVPIVRKMRKPSGKTSVFMLSKVLWGCNLQLPRVVFLCMNAMRCPAVSVGSAEQWCSPRGVFCVPLPRMRPGQACHQRGVLRFKRCSTAGSGATAEVLLNPFSWYWKELLEPP